MTHSQAGRRGMVTVFLAAAAVLAGGCIERARAQIDLNGPWGVELTGPGITGLHCIFDVTQSGSSFSVTSGCPLIGPISAAGVIDTVTGDFSATGSATPVFCPSLSLNGQASPASDGFTGTFDCNTGISGSYVGSLCGNGVVDAGEDCENVACCGPTCQWAAGSSCENDGNPCTYELCDGAGACNPPTFAPVGELCPGDGVSCTRDICDGAGNCSHPSWPDGTECFDSNDCTGPDACSAGVCVGPLRPAGALCGFDSNPCTLDFCDGAGTCGPGPCDPCCSGPSCSVQFDIGCKRPISPAGKVRLKGDGGTASRLQWKWTHGEQTDVAEFGDPLNSTSYTFCVYDSQFVQYRAQIPPGGDCGGACWKSSPSGFTYRDSERTPDGIDLFKLKSGAAGQSKILVRGKGTNLKLDVDDFIIQATPILVRLKASNGECWEASYSDVRIENLSLKAQGGQ